MEKNLPIEKIPSLSFCIAMDAIGCISYIIPGLLEFTDAVWAPISEFIFMNTFGGKFGKVGAVTSIGMILPWKFMFITCFINFSFLLLKFAFLFSEAYFISVIWSC